ncbi:restriction endonuclease [Micromonospora sp. CPCC 205556]|uniref:restriction endonuclease n=1 Tax=Micromonospora sp. CPCC 205556 TaxID=3122398 RepID=UPI002FF0C03E
MADTWYPGQQTLWQEAERAAVGFMQAIGFKDAALTNPGADRGLDVVASGAAAQVKALATPVGRPDVQRLRGASFNVPTVLFFSLNGYSPGAIEYADQVRIALFTFGPGLVPHPVNEFAQHLALLANPAAGPDASTSMAFAPETRRPGWREWSTAAKIAAVLVIPAVITIAGPVLFAVGREATRRSALEASAFDSAAQRRAIVTTAGVAGTIMLLSVAVQNLVWAITGDAPADGSPGFGAVLGAAVGLAMVITLNFAARAGKLSWMWVPRMLWSPEQETDASAMR